MKIPVRKFIKPIVSGTVFEITDKYRPPFKLLGKGAFGVVCSATDYVTNEKVAIKKITNAFSNSDSAKNVLREIKILRHMDHENIVKIKDVIPNNFSDSRC